MQDRLEWGGQRTLGFAGIQRTRDFRTSWRRVYKTAGLNKMMEFKELQD
jgi:hypothetical protein